MGVSSPVIQKMIGDMYSHGINIHSIMVLRHGKVACEAWSAPLTPEMPHQVFSVSKSVLATAYGFALDEGKIERPPASSMFSRSANRKSAMKTLKNSQFTICSQ